MWMIIWHHLVIYIFQKETSQVPFHPLTLTDKKVNTHFQVVSFMSNFFRSIYQKFREYDVLDKRKTVTALRAGEDRAILLGLSMVLLSVMMYFVLGITILRSYSDR